MWHIYIVTNLINGKRYVGQTTNLRRREGNHRKARHETCLLHAAIRKYGWESFCFRHVESCESLERANDLERRWIRLCDSFAPSGGHGYNLTIGGDGVQGSVRSRAARDRQSEITQSMWKVGGQLRSIDRSGHRNNFYGRRHTEETKRLIGASSRTRRHPAARSVVQKTLDGAEVARFDSSYKAEQTTGIDSRGIRQCCQGRLRKAGGYRWEYT